MSMQNVKNSSKIKMFYKMVWLKVFYIFILAQHHCIKIFSLFQSLNKYTKYIVSESE